MQRVNVTNTPDNVASTWNSTNYQDGSAVESVLGAVTLRTAETVIIARKDFIETWKSRLIIGKLANVSFISLNANSCYIPNYC